MEREPSHSCAQQPPGIQRLWLRSAMRLDEGLIATVPLEQGLVEQGLELDDLAMPAGAQPEDATARAFVLVEL